MSLPRYSEYKDSGVDWLGKVPAHWQVQPLKSRYAVVGGSTPRSDVPEYWDGGINWVTPADLSRLSGFEIRGSLRTITDVGLQSCGTSLVPSGSLILSTRAPIGSLGLATMEVCTNQGCKALVPRSGELSRFAAYAMSIAGPALNVRGKGTTFLELSGDELASFRLAFPGREEQGAIATFLDCETAKIDALIAEQEKLLALLAEKRQATISHAVTRGLDPNAPMKDSGIPWLGKVPVHWEIRRLRHAVPAVTVGIVVEPSKYYVDEGVPALRSLNVSSGEIRAENMVFISDESNELLGKSKLRSGDVVVVRSGQAGAAAVVPPELDGCNCIDLIIIRKPLAGSERFMCWYLASNAALYQFEGGSEGAIQKHFNIGTAMNLVLPWPNAEEQTRISDYLDAQVTEIDSLADRVSHAIALLRERRSALIAAAVTGQIDVRGLLEAQAA